MRRCAGLVTAGLAIAGVAIAAILLVARAADGPGAGLAHGPATAPAAQPAAEEPREPHTAGPTESAVSTTTATAASSAPPTTSDSSPAQQTAPPAPSPAPDPDPIASEPLETLIVSSPPDSSTPVVTREEIASESDPKGSSELTPPAPKPPRDPPSTAAARSADGEASGGKAEERTAERAYTWQDGDRTLTVWLQEDGLQPVFRSESGSLMTLPGGVILLLAASWDQTRIDQFFARHDIQQSRVSAQAFADNAFFVATAPGFPSLELANALAGQDGVLIASPNWRTEAELR